MSDKIVIKKASNKFEYGQCIQVRTTVFVHGQSVPMDREIDQFEDSAHHYIAYHNNKMAGAVRWRVSEKDSSIAKIERLATLADFRGKGIGKALMNHILQDIRSHLNIQTIILGAQDHAIPFYESMGFEVFGEGYLDGGSISHHDMKIKLNT